MVSMLHDCLDVPRSRCRTVSMGPMWELPPRGGSWTLTKCSRSVCDVHVLQEHEVMCERGDMCERDIIKFECDMT